MGFSKHEIKCLIKDAISPVVHKLKCDLVAAQSDGDTTIDFSPITEVLNDIKTVLEGLQTTDYEIKALPPVHFCGCDEGTYISLVCQKFEDGILIEISTIYLSPTGEVIDALPACASPCIPTAEPIIKTIDVCFEDGESGYTIICIDPITKSVTPSGNYYINSTPSSSPIIECGTYEILEEKVCES